MATLPDKHTDLGAETRLLLAECRGPSFSAFSLSDATLCMDYMDLVLWNRVNNHPKQFMARTATLIGVITAPGQFAGFENYPNYDSRIVHNLQSMVDISNNPRDKRSSAFEDFINAAIAAATPPRIPDASPGFLAAWRTAGASSPGPRFTLYKTIFGNDFYYL
jgi:hypothetical protein